MSVVILLENLIKFVEINSQRIIEGKSTICKADNGETIRDYLPCSSKGDKGEFIIKCEDCPFSSVEAAKETIAELEHITKKEKVFSILRGEKRD